MNPATWAVVFPRAHREGRAVEAGTAIGMDQGVGLGLFAGAALAFGLGWCRKLDWAWCARGVAVLVGGGLVGLALGIDRPASCVGR